MSRRQPIRVLAIETSCDETAASVVQDGRYALSNVVASQVRLHAPYGGVFPELASRQHMRDIVPVIRRALAEAAVGLDMLDAVAVTTGPGLAGSLLVGVNAAKGLALAAGLRLLAVNHLEGHLYANWLHIDGRLRTPGPGDPGRMGDPPFPHLGLIVSGGHTDLVHVTGHGRHRLMGATLDDAAGEAFDKAARTLGLGYPGGPALEHAAAGGTPGTVSLPVAVTPSPLDFSFSGLKTAVLKLAQEAERSGRPLAVADVAASFQEAVASALTGRLRLALAAVDARAVLVAGGVSANTTLRRRLTEAVDVPVLCPPLELCTDNAAMVAAAAFWRLAGEGPAEAARTAGDWMAVDVDSSASLADRRRAADAASGTAAAIEA